MAADLQPPGADADLKARSVPGLGRQSTSAQRTCSR